MSVSPAFFSEPAEDEGEARNEPTKAEAEAEGEARNEPVKAEAEVKGEARNEPASGSGSEERASERKRKRKQQPKRASKASNAIPPQKNRPQRTSVKRSERFWRKKRATVRAKRV